MATDVNRSSVGVPRYCDCLARHRTIERNHEKPVDATPAPLELCSAREGV